MKTQVLKENIEIVIALALPLALILIFMLWKGVTSVAVESPQHDFFVVDDYNESRSPLLFSVSGNELNVQYQQNWKDDKRSYQYNSVPHLYRVHVEDMSLEEIYIDIPPQGDYASEPTLTTLDVPALAGLSVSSRNISPDGYTYDKSTRYRNDNLMLDIFSSRQYKRTPSLTKDGRLIPITGLDKYGAKFLGWITEE